MSDKQSDKVRRRPPHDRHCKQIIKAICRRLAAGESIRSISRDRSMPSFSCILKMIKEDRYGLFAATPWKRQKGGRLRLYARKIADKICEQLADGFTLTSIAGAPGMPPRTTVMDWVREDIDGFRERYERSRELGYQKMLDDIIDIADSAKDVQDRKIRIAARQWMFNRALPAHERGPVTVKIVC